MTDTDSLSRLQDLLGQTSLIGVHEEAPMQSEPLAAANEAFKEHFLSSDSDDESIMNRYGKPYIKAYLPLTNDASDASLEAPESAENTAGGSCAKQMNDGSWQLGQPVAEDEVFIPWNSVKKYPYTYIGKANRDRVDKRYFAAGKLNDRTWCFFYLRRLEPESRPILLVTAKQFQDFLTEINKKLNIQLTIPNIGPDGGFQVTFEDNSMPRPRYLGQATSKEMADSLLDKELPQGYIPKWEELSTVAPTDRSIAAFKAKIDMILRAQKAKKLAGKEKAKIERKAKQQSWHHAIKRVQRYLGIRDIKRAYQDDIRTRLGAEGLEGAALDEAVEVELANSPLSTFFDPDQPCIFPPEDSVVFVCVDVEAWERDQRIITEIGISTLDTEDIKDMVPGEGGTKWMAQIRARHFRIAENSDYENHEFVHGCSDRFEFGESEWISIADAPGAVASCFKPPYSCYEEPIDLSVRNVILVGHDVDSDIMYLRKMGYNVLNLGNLKEKHDTAAMYRYLRRETNPRNLGAILADLGITGWNLHNAGNDAVYTLQAMIGIAIKHLVEKQARLASKEFDLHSKIQESVVEAKERIIEQNEGWSSGGEDSDGGAAVAPRALGRASKKSTYDLTNDGSSAWTSNQSSSSSSQCNTKLTEASGSGNASATGLSSGMASKMVDEPKDDEIVYW